MKAHLLALAICGLTVTALARTPAVSPSFEAATIKRSTLSEGADSDSTPGRLHLQGTLRSIIQIAYGLRKDQIEGGPSWLDDEHYEINAKAENPAQVPELRTMLQTLLGERFGLRFHRSSKTATGYALVIAGTGLKMSESAAGDSHSTNGGRGSLKGTNATIARLAERLSNLLGEPVVDGTGNAGFFDFTLTWSLEKTTPSPASINDTDSGPSIFTALQEQLGLKLERRRVPLEILVIDSVTRPTLD
jgi:uncharacterized protein (TIGR03435 family)